MPSEATIRAIVRATEGAVRADDFYDDLPPPAEPAQRRVFTLAEEDEARARLWALLGRLLLAPPDAAMLATVAGLAGDESTPIGAALARLGAAARSADADKLREEYDALFIGLVRGELVPFASYYLTGFLHEKPLANLRESMARLGIALRDGVAEPEDHIGAVAEMMAGLIAGDFGEPADLATQRRFFEDHIAGWAARFFEDLEGAAAADFYKPVGALGRALVGIEAEAFEMAA
ncbi:MAG: molecular chaperone TorD family protein [Rhodospirillales bacterium]|nr:molecular chaperone TorD family protein [Rhodospirillales bacterium]